MSYYDETLATLSGKLAKLPSDARRKEVLSDIRSRFLEKAEFSSDARLKLAKPLLDEAFRHEQPEDILASLALSNAPVDYILSLLHPKADGENATLTTKAVALSEAVIPVLVWARDNAGLKVNAFNMFDFFSLDAILNFLTDSRFVHLPENLEHGLISYLSTLHGFSSKDWKAERDVRASFRPDETALLEHSYVLLQLPPLSQTEASPNDYLTSLLKVFKEQEGGNLWERRAIHFSRYALPAIIWARDNAGLKIDEGTLFKHLELGSLVMLLTEERFAALPEELEKPLLDYLVSLGFVEWVNSTRAERAAFIKLNGLTKVMSLMDVAYRQHSVILRTLPRTLVSDTHDCLLKTLLALYSVSASTDRKEIETEPKKLAESNTEKALAHNKSYQ